MYLQWNSLTDWQKRFSNCSIYISAKENKDEEAAETDAPNEDAEEKVDTEEPAAEENGEDSAEADESKAEPSEEPPADAEAPIEEGLNI